MHKKLTVDGIDYPLDSQKTLLENLELNAIEVEYQCRDGHCGACKCQLISGKINYINEPLAYCRNSDILPCCSISEEDISLTIAG